MMQPPVHSQQLPDHIQLEGLTLRLAPSPRRRTLDLAIERDGSLVLRCPSTATISRLLEFAGQHREWLFRKLAEKEALLHATPKKEFVTGEGFSYLGRNYRLAIVEKKPSIQPALRLEAGRFKLLRSQLPKARALFVQWYIRHGQPWMERRVELFAPRMNVHPTTVTLRDLGFRWGSCSASGALNFHWATISLPPSIVEYIIVHELAHLQERHHTPAFWLLVERTLPDYALRKAWLAENGSKVVGGW